MNIFTSSLPPAVPSSSLPPSSSSSSCTACPAPLVLHDGACLPSCPARTFPEKVPPSELTLNQPDQPAQHDHHDHDHNQPDHPDQPEQDEGGSGLVCKSCHHSCESCVGPLDTQCGKCGDGSFYFERRCNAFINVSMHQCINVSMYQCVNLERFVHSKLRRCVPYCPAGYFSDSALRECLSW